ncbi:MAG: transcriptional repressor [Desulfobulbaceae bacterium]|nr:transcriptional repressor [Desulfobulbaceae bacterium]
MTEHKKIIQDKLAAFEQACRTAGLKVTHQRIEIYRELAMATDHPSAEGLYKRLHDRLPTLSLDTVYRTLSTFEELGLIKRVQTVESQTRFEAQMLQHHHLICDRCNKIIDFQWQGFDNISIPEEVSRLGKVSSKNVILKGICNECLQRQEVAAPVV